MSEQDKTPEVDASALEGFTDKALWDMLPASDVVNILHTRLLMGAAPVAKQTVELREQLAAAREDRDRYLEREKELTSQVATERSTATAALNMCDHYLECAEKAEDELIAAKGGIKLIVEVAAAVQADRDWLALEVATLRRAKVKDAREEAEG